MKVRMMAKANVGAKRNKDSAMTSSVVIVPIFHERINNMKNFKKELSLPLRLAEGSFLYTSFMPTSQQPSLISKTHWTVVGTQL